MRAFLIRFIACVASGCLWFIACARFDTWALAWAAMVPCLLALRGVSTPRRAFGWGWLTGLVASAGGFYWISTLLMRFGHLHWLPAGALFMLMASYQGLHFGAMAYVLHRVHRRAPDLPLTLTLPLVMTGFEFLMPFIFPWYLAITQAWVVPVIQVADLGGPSAVSFLLLLSNGAIYDLAVSRLERKPLRWRPAAVAAGVIAAALVYGGLRMAQYDARWEQGPKVKVGVVQANVGITQKGRAALAIKHLALHHKASQELERRGAELLVWPESSYPFAFLREMQRDWPANSMRQVMRGFSTPLVFGVLTLSQRERYPYNSAYYMEPGGRITGKFDKNFLLVFGEYIPFKDHLPWLDKYFPEMSHFAHGTTVTTFKFRDYRLAPMICYEDIIPSFGRRLAPLRPHLLVNITNDAWFGRTTEPYEHMALSVYRAVELRTGLVRAVNTGVSAFIDASGRLRASTRSVDPVETPGVGPDTLLEQVTMLEGGGTVYAVVGDLMSYLCLAGMVALVVWSHRRRRGAKAPPKRGKRKR